MKTSDRLPWAFIVLSFLLLLTAWGGLIFVANKFRVDHVPLDSPSAEVSR